MLMIYPQTEKRRSLVLGSRMSCGGEAQAVQTINLHALDFFCTLVLRKRGCACVYH